MLLPACYLWINPIMWI